MKRTKNDTKEEEKADTLKPALEFFRFYFFFSQQQFWVSLVLSAPVSSF